jgi:hypothetical protein
MLKGLQVISRRNLSTSQSGKGLKEKFSSVIPNAADSETSERRYYQFLCPDTSMNKYVLEQNSAN